MLDVGVCVLTVEQEPQLRLILPTLTDCTYPTAVVAHTGELRN